MPETQLVSLPASYFPTPPSGAAQGQAVCSVQQARANQGGLGTAPPEVLAQVPASQCAAVALLDLVTLNSDRHGDNLLIADDGSLVPIDHGCAFPLDDKEGHTRIANGLSGPHNFVLRLPGAHQPMTEQMAAGVRGLDPMALGGSLSREVSAVEQEHPDMSGLCDNATLVNSV